MSAEIETAQAAWETANIANALSSAPKLDDWQAVGPFPADSFDAAYDSAFVAEKQIRFEANLCRRQIEMDTPSRMEGRRCSRADGRKFGHVSVPRDSCRRTPCRSRCPSAVTTPSKCGSTARLLSRTKPRGPLLPDQEKATVNLRVGDNILLMKIVNGGGIGGFYFKAQETGLPANIARAF